MKLLRTIMATVLLLCVLLTTACGSSLSLEETAETVTTEETVEEQPIVIAPKPTRFTIKDVQDKLNLIGERTAFTDTGLLALEWVGNGFELKLDAAEGGTDVMMTGRCNYVGTYLVYVDGVQTEEPLTMTSGNKEYLLAHVDAGVHTIRVLKETQAGTNRNNYNNIVSFSFFGEVLECEKTEKELYLEFVGDSYFVGFGNMGSVPESTTFSEESSFIHSLPYLTCQALNADYSVVAHSQVGLVQTLGSMNLFNLYNNNNGYRDLDFVYAPDRIPDAIIIHAGMEDSSSKLTVGDFVIKGEEFINTIRSYYGEAGKDIPIVWIYGTYYYTTRTNEIRAIASRNDNVYALEGSFGRNGSGPKDGIRYPNAAEHQATTDILVPFLQELLNK